MLVASWAFNSLKDSHIILERTSKVKRKIASKPKKIRLVILERLSYSGTMPELKKNKAAQMLGRLGGLKGGKARAAKLSPERRREIAQKAIQARWAKVAKEKGSA